MVKSSSIAIIGAGSVGAAIAYALMLRKVSAEVLLVDIDEKRCEGEALDLSDGQIVSTTKVKKGTYAEAGQCDIIVISAGAKQREGESRVQLIDRNYKILNSVFNSMKPLSPNAVILLVANPVDVLAYFAQKISGLPRHQVFGSGTFLDSARLRGQIAEKLNVSEAAVHAYILGEHGDSQFAAFSSARVAGMPLLSFPQLNQKDLDDMAEYTKNKAYKIIEGKGATYFGIGAVVSSICESVLRNERHIRPVSCYQESLGCYLSMPCVLGSKGIEQILPIPLDEKEKKQLAESAASLKKIITDYETK
jgi:L-lactate dehydrogenase